MPRDTLYKVGCRMLYVLSKDLRAAQVADGVEMFLRTHMEQVPEEELLNYAGAMSRWLSCFSEGAANADAVGGVTPKRAQVLEALLKGLLHYAVKDYFKDKKVVSIGFVDRIGEEYLQELIDTPVAATAASKIEVGTDVAESFFSDLDPTEDGFAGVIIALVDAHRQMNVYLDPPPGRKYPVPVPAYCAGCCSMAIVALRELDRRSPLDVETKENIITETERDYLKEAPN